MKTLLVAALSSALFASTNTSHLSIQTINQIPDALSVTLPHDTSTAEVSYTLNGQWSAWEKFSVDNEQDPLLRESNLIMLPPFIESVRIRSTNDVIIHPIDIDEGPVTYNVAATNNVEAPRILSRSEWGADDSLLFREPSSAAPYATEADTETGDTGGATSARVQECEDAQLYYPNEFKTKKTVRTDEYNRTFRWAHTYSPSVKLIAVHHTAVTSAGDTRSGAERVRAIYAYHANNRGWGDVGYHFLIDENGQVYEGKSGGKYVVGGHAYCNNVGTLGIALLGNFEEEKPTQKQLKSLQWLLKDLTDEYDIDASKQVVFHGKKTDPIVGHRDLVSTACPGFYVYGALAQIRGNVASGDVYASVKLPNKPTAAKKVAKKPARTSARQASSAAKVSPNATGVLTRATRRLLSTQASQILRRKLGSNPGRIVETAVAKRAAARMGSASSRRRTVIKSSQRSSQSSRIRSSRPSGSSKPSESFGSPRIRIRLTRQENGATNCSQYDLNILQKKYRGTIECTIIDNLAALINEVSLEDYMAGLAEEPDTEPYEKQRAFAIAARTYAAYYSDPNHLRKFPGKPYDGSDSPATFQLYSGIAFEKSNPRWVKAVKNTANIILTKDGKVIRAPYFSADDGRTRSPSEAGWNNFPFAEVFTSKEDPWCAGQALRGHGVGMSGCGAKGQANEGKTAEDILKYYYPGTALEAL